MALEKLEKNVKELARNGLRRAAFRTKERLSQNANLTDHTLDDLERLGHPYSRRKPRKIHNPDYLVHRQTGKLQDHIKVTQEGNDTYSIGVDPNEVPYLIDVVEGNSVMIPRDFPFHTLKELEDENIIHDTMESAISEAVKRS